MEDFISQLTAAASSQSGTSHSPLDVLVALSIATLLGSFLAMIYNLTYTGKRGERHQISYTIILLTLGGSLVWLLVADSIVRAFGIAGALSVIRYRTRVQDPKDTTLLFFGVIIGMACGLHSYAVAALGTLFISVVLAAIRLVNDLTLRGEATPAVKPPRPVMEMPAPLPAPQGDDTP
jgi:hypothetical protein